MMKFHIFNSTAHKEKSNTYISNYDYMANNERLFTNDEYRKSREAVLDYCLKNSSSIDSEISCYDIEMMDFDKKILADSIIRWITDYKNLRFI